jgi:hypothetical protein
MVHDHAGEEVGPRPPYKMAYKAISLSRSAFSGLTLVRPGSLPGSGMCGSNAAADIPSGR